MDGFIITRQECPLGQCPGLAPGNKLWCVCIRAALAAGDKETASDFFRRLEAKRKAEDPNAIPNALWAAVDAGDIDAVRAYLRNQREKDTEELAIALEKTGWRNMTPLQLAAHRGYAEILEELLRAGANAGPSGGPPGPFQDYETPIFLACRGRHIEVVRVLARNGIDLNFRSRGNGMVALHYATSSGATDIIRFLIERKVDLMVTSKDGFGLIHHAAKRTENYATEVVRMLVETIGVPINAQNSKDGKTPLHYAAQNDHKDLVEYLLQAGAAADLTDVKGNAPIHLASKYGFVAILRLLLEAKMDPNARGEYGNTPLHIIALFAARVVNEMEEMTTLLLAAGADPTLTNQADESAFGVAVQVGNELLISILSPQEHA